MSKWSEVADRYLEALRQSSTFALAGLVIVATYIVVAPAIDRRIGGKRLNQALLAACVLAAVLWSWHLRWISDDTFITLRYAKNWIEGNGLVFNIGEKVEGYTNFLWLALLAVMQLLGMDGPTASVLFGLLSLAVTIVITFRLGRGAAADEPAVAGGGPFVLSCAMLAANYAFASFGTGGLETMFATMLVTLAVERAQKGQLFTAGISGIAGAMAHPDHALFYIALAAAIILEPARRRHIARFLLPFVLIYLPYTIVRWRYFGDFFPNTYYAKAAHLSYFSQGGFYVGSSLLSSGAWAVIPLVLYSCVIYRRNFLVRYALISLPLYVTYVAKIGGDYMMGRLLCSILPVLFVVSELGLRHIISVKGRYLGAAAALLLVPPMLTTPLVRPGEVKWYLTDERTMYNLLSLKPLELGGGTPLRVRRLKQYLADQGLRFSYAAFAIGLVGWETQWPIVDIHGLTDRALARQPLPQRGRPGHERIASPEHIVARGADLAGMPVFPGEYADLTKVTLDGEAYFLTHYSPALAEKYPNSDHVQFVHFPAYLDTYLAAIHTKEPATIRRDIDFFDRFYFSHAEDPARRQKLKDYVGS